MESSDIFALIFSLLVFGGLIALVIYYIRYKEVPVEDKYNKKKIKVLNKLIVKEKKERVISKVIGGGFMYGGIGVSDTNTKVEVKHILVVYDTYTNKYDEVEATVDTYYKAEVDKEITFDLEQFVHYEDAVEMKTN